jgi:hypothetical protein
MRVFPKTPGAVLLCERDCDQEEIQQLASIDELMSAMQLVIAYCDGRSSECPTFRYVQR